MTGSAKLAVLRLRLILPLDRLRTGHPWTFRPGSVFIVPGEWA